MDSIQLLVSICFLLGNSVPYIQGGLLDPITSIFVPGENKNTPGNVFNSILSPFRENGEPPQGSEIRRNKPRNHRNPNAWWVTPSGPVIHNIFNNPETTPDYDAIVAQKYPEATNLLAKLKELNKLKDEARRNQQESRPDVINKQTPQPIDLGNDTKPTPGSSYDSEEKTTEEAPKEATKVMKSITEKHFYFQAQPVVPEGEDTRTDETIYYVDA